MTQSYNVLGLRGQRVPEMKPDDILKTVKFVIRKFSITSTTLKNMDIFIDKLWAEARINIEIEYDDNWIGFANALCDPTQLTISIPESLYKRLNKKRKLDLEALRIFFHELGHLLLVHKAVLHQTDTLATQFEDSEWQADCFADMVLDSLGVVNNKQLSLF